MQVETEIEFLHAAFFKFHKFLVIYNFSESGDTRVPKNIEALK